MPDDFKATSAGHVDVANHKLNTIRMLDKLEGLEAVFVARVSYPASSKASTSRRRMKSSSSATSTRTGWLSHGQSPDIPV